MLRSMSYFPGAGFSSSDLFSAEGLCSLEPNTQVGAEEKAPVGCGPIAGKWL